MHVQHCSQLAHVGSMSWLGPGQMHCNCCLPSEDVNNPVVEIMHMQAVGKDGTSPHVRACRADVYFVMGAHENAAEVRSPLTHLQTSRRLDAVRMRVPMFKCSVHAVWSPQNPWQINP